MKLSQKRLKEILHYSPNIGLFYPAKKRRGVRFGVAAGSVNGNGYILICVDRKRYYAHRLAWLYMTGKWPLSEIDHKNGLRSDNRWKNLRIANSSENRCNSSIRSDNRSGYKGVQKHASGKWRARVKKNGTTYEAGVFADKKVAALARNAMAVKLHGDFAKC